MGRHFSTSPLVNKVTFGSGAFPGSRLFLFLLLFLFLGDEKEKEEYRRFLPRRSYPFSSARASSYSSSSSSSSVSLSSSSDNTFCVRGCLVCFVVCSHFLPIFRCLSIQIPHNEKVYKEFSLSLSFRTTTIVISRPLFGRPAVREELFHFVHSIVSLFVFFRERGSF